MCLLACLIDCLLACLLVCLFACLCVRVFVCVCVCELLPECDEGVVRPVVDVVVGEVQAAQDTKGPEKIYINC